MPQTHYARRIKLDDGWEVSIICKHLISYGEDEKLFECAMVNPDNYIDNDSVTGYLDFHQVAEYIRKAREKHDEVKI
jgi:hypothetical protein